ncbi:MAG TPA: response regulator [Pirellulales bacterium]|nr:response regulator [Pirellulales bacterium]
MELACSLLLVDDDEEFLEIVARRFRRRGMLVALATNAPAAIEAAEQHGFHVAIIDRSLAGHDGLDLMVRLRDDRPDLRVIVLSGHSDAQTIAHARDRGAFDYLVKPSSLADLEAAVARAHRAGAERPGP